MISIQQCRPFFSGVIFAVLALPYAPRIMLASSPTSPLCNNRDMMTEMEISTRDFEAAFCSLGYYDDSEDRCFIPTDYYYVGQSKKTGETIVLANATQSVENGILIWKARNENYTYQIAQMGGSQGRSWRSLSVFENGKRVYHRIVSGYGGSLPCL